MLIGRAIAAIITARRRRPVMTDIMSLSPRERADIGATEYHLLARQKG
jgi:hypothetical protein